MPRPNPLACTLLLLALAVPARSEETSAARLRAVAGREGEARAAALAWWEALAPLRQVEVLRAALHGDDPEAARIAAASVGYPYLDAAEARFAATLLHERPRWILGPPPELGPLQRRERVGLGAADALPYVESWVRAASPTEPGLLGDVHRALSARHAEALAPLLARAPRGLFEDLMFLVTEIGREDRRDRVRAVVARGLRYGLQRLRAERAGAPAPRWEDVPAGVEPPPGGGLPPAFREIAEATFPGTTTGFLLADRPGPLSVDAPYAWLQRWAQDVVPGPADVPFLLRVVDAEFGASAGGAGYPLSALWAIRALARLPRQHERLGAWAAGTDERACGAAAALVEVGVGDRFLWLLHDADQGALPEDAVRWLHDLQWLTSREDARTRTAGALAAAPPGGMPGEMGLDPESRLWHERAFGFAVEEADLDAIEDGLWKRETPAATLLAWHARIRPGRLTPERAAALLARLRAMPALAGEDLDLAAWDPGLAELERLQPAATRALLVAWLDTQPALREPVLVRLARLGVTGHEEAMCAAWPEAYGSPWVLGRVRGAAVRAFLEEQADAADAERSLEAVQALLVEAGLPDAAVAGLEALAPADHPAARAEARASLRAGDAVGALLRLAEAVGPYGGLGTVHDARVRTWLVAQQAERAQGRWWAATGALAVAGDAEARAALRLVVEDDRTSILDQLDDVELGDDPGLTDALLERLDSNCCLGWAAAERLRHLYPTLPFDTGYGGAGTERTRAWLRSFRWVPSPLLDGRVGLRP